MRFFVITTAFLLLAATGGAQAQIVSLSTPASIVLTPRQPGPNQEVSMEMQSSFVNLDRATISWFIDGEKAAESVGLTRVKVKTGGLGKRLVITARAEEEGGVVIEGQTIVQPIVVDLAWEAESYVPAFYQGRALPGAGAYVRAEANPFFVRANGTRIPRTELIYTWKLGETVLTNVSGTGKYAARIPLPAFAGEEIISVHVSSRDNSFVGSNLVRIPAVAPYVVLYQDDPLRGVAFNNALQSGSSLSESEITLAAIPYFASIIRLNDPTLVFSWLINDIVAPTDTSDPSRLTISRNGTTLSQAKVQLSIEHVRELFQNATRRWIIQLGGTTSGGEISNPDTNPFISGNGQ